MAQVDSKLSYLEVTDKLSEGAWLIRGCFQIPGPEGKEPLQLWEWSYILGELGVTPENFSKALHGLADMIEGNFKDNA